MYLSPVVASSSSVMYSSPRAVVRCVCDSYAEPRATVVVRGLPISDLSKSFCDQGGDAPRRSSQLIAQIVIFAKRGTLQVRRNFTGRLDSLPIDENFGQIFRFHTAPHGTTHAAP